MQQLGRAPSPKQRARSSSKTQHNPLSSKPLEENKRTDSKEKEESGTKESTTETAVLNTSTNASSDMKAPTKVGQHKIMITGDDILIEYVARLVKQLSSTAVENVKPGQLTQIEKFVIHYVWKQPD